MLTSLASYRALLIISTPNCLSYTSQFSSLWQPMFVRAHTQLAPDSLLIVTLNRIINLGTSTEVSQRISPERYKSHRAWAKIQTRHVKFLQGRDRADD